MSDPTYTELLRECRREKEMRISFYPRLVLQGKMTQGLMDHRIRLMQGMVTLLERLTLEEAEKNRQPDLFDNQPVSKQPVSKS